VPKDVCRSPCDFVGGQSSIARSVRGQQPTNATNGRKCRENVVRRAARTNGAKNIDEAAASNGSAGDQRAVIIGDAGERVDPFIATDGAVCKVLNRSSWRVSPHTTSRR
jgi:hypothetical protein